MRAAGDTALLIDGDVEFNRSFTALLDRLRINSVETTPTDALRDFYSSRPDLVIVNLRQPVERFAGLFETIRQLAAVPLLTASAEDGGTDAAARYGLAPTITSTKGSAPGEAGSSRGGAAKWVGARRRPLSAL